MINKKFIMSISAATLLLPSLVIAQGFAPVTPFAGTSTGTLIQAITNIVNALLALAAVIAAIFVIIGGVRYVTSQGDEDAEASARGTILFAVVGVIIIALSAVIVNYIIAVLPAG